MRGKTMTKKKAFVKCKFCSADGPVPSIYNCLPTITEKEVVVDKAGLILDPKNGVYTLRFSVRALCPSCWGQTETVLKCHLSAESIAEMVLDAGGYFQEEADQ
jgi:hypothetical protein